MGIRFLGIILFISIAFVTYGQLTVNAGNDTILCSSSSYGIGTKLKVTGGTAPFQYSWSPAAGLSSTTLSNPQASASSGVNYTVTVTDSKNLTATDVILISWDPQSFVNAGNGGSYCLGKGSVNLGSANNVAWSGLSYSWTPNTDISSTTSPTPIATPTVTTTYTLTTTGAVCGVKVFTTTVTVHQPPSVSAGPDLTIDEGQTIHMLATGAQQYNWIPDKYMNSAYIPNPDIKPDSSMYYVLVGIDNYGCENRDSIHITVIPGKKLFFYNTFTPNLDNDNETFFIGNIEKYPQNQLQIFNRLGQLVYQVKEYKNDWDGKVFGTQLPAATYYYVFDPGDGSEKYKGSVTIIR